MIECNDEASSARRLRLWSAYSGGNPYIIAYGEIVTTVSTSSKCWSVVTYAVAWFLLQIKTETKKTHFTISYAMHEKCLFGLPNLAMLSLPSFQSRRTSHLINSQRKRERTSLETNNQNELSSINRISHQSDKLAEPGWKQIYLHQKFNFNVLKISSNRTSAAWGVEKTKNRLHISWGDPNETRGGRADEMGGTIPT